MQDIELKCVECKGPFTFTVRDQEFYERNNFSKPKRCRACRNKRKADKAAQSELSFCCGAPMLVSGQCTSCGAAGREQ